jgi:hypothetical protein
MMPTWVFIAGLVAVLFAKITHVHRLVKVDALEWLHGRRAILSIRRATVPSTHVTQRVCHEGDTLAWHGKPLVQEEITIPDPTGRQVLLRVRACGVCRTDLHLIDGELATARKQLFRIAKEFSRHCHSPSQSYTAAGVEGPRFRSKDTCRPLQRGKP